MQSAPGIALQRRAASYCRGPVQSLCPRGGWRLPARSADCRSSANDQGKIVVRLNTFAGDPSIMTTQGDYSAKSDETLVRASQKGDMKAFEELVARHRDKVYARA